jgi:hypothetical protein
MAMTTKLKGRLVALLLLAVVLALPVIRFLQLRDGREDGAPPPTTTGTKPPTGPRPPRPEATPQPGLPEGVTASETFPDPEHLREEGKRRLEELKAAGEDVERKRQILQELVSLPVDLDQLLEAVEGMPEDERAAFYVQLAGRCATEQTAKYFSILDGMPPGPDRNEVIRAGMDALDFPNLQRMMDQVRKQGDPEEITRMAQNFQLLENPALKSADLLGYARKLPPPTEEEEEGSMPGEPTTLRDSIAYGAGVLDAGSGGKTDLNRLRSDFGEETAQHYIEGMGTALMDNTAEPERFTGFLAATTMTAETRQHLVGEFADRALQGGTAEAVALGGKLSAADADTYYAELGRQLAGRDTKEAARVLGGLPAGRARQVMAAQLSRELEAQGMTGEAARWRQEKGK